MYYVAADVTFTSWKLLLAVIQKASKHWPVLQCPEDGFGK